MSNIFVNRREELDYLRKSAEGIRNGRGEVILLEGPAGIGKSALLDEFKKSIKKDYEILEGICTRDSKYIPYDLFSRALKNYGTLKDIRDLEERRKLMEFAEELMKKRGLVFVNENESGGGYKLYREIREKLDGIYFSMRQTEDEDGIWLTETKTEKRIANPTNMEFSIIPIIDDLKRKKGKKVFYIEGINYLIYLNGINSVVDFLHTLHSISLEGHIIIISGKMEYLKEEERNSLLPLFDEEITIEGGVENKENCVEIVNENKDGIIFTSRRGKGDYTVGKGFLEPHRIDFELFDRISEEISKGNNIVLDCLPLLIHYNGIRRIYIWLKAVADFARKNRVKLYINVRGLSNSHINMIKDLADASEIATNPAHEDIDKESPLKFYDTIFNFLHIESQKKPVVMILENLQWSDKSSLKLLKYLARNIIRSRILLIGTYREGDISQDENTVKIFREIQNLENGRLIGIKPLSRKFLGEMFGNLDGDSLKLIYEKSGGNPLLARAIIQNMEKKEIMVPDSIRKSIEMQIDSLDDRTLYFLRFLSVLGEEVDIDNLRNFHPNYYRYIEKVKDKFLHVSDGKIKFLYSIYRDVIYQGTSKDVKKEFHRKIGEFMEERGDVIKSAYHYYMAGDKRAIKLLKKASEKSVKMMAIRNAIDYYEKALEIARKYGLKDEIYQFYEKMGDYYMLLGEYKNAIDMYEKSLEEGNKKEVDLGTKIGVCQSSLGEYSMALDIFNKYLEKAKGIKRAKIIGQIGIIKWHIGDFDSSLKNLKEYLKIARKYGSKEDIAEAYRNMAVVYHYKSDYKKVLEYGKKALEIASEIGDYGKIANSYNIIGIAYDGMYKFDEALKYYKKYMDISQRIGNFKYLSMAYNNIAIVYNNMGEMEKYREYLLKSLEYNFKIGNKRDLSITYYNLARAEEKMGDYLMALKYMEKSTDYANEAGDIYLISTNYLNISFLYADLEEYDKAEKYVKMSMLIAEDENYESEKIASYLQYASLLTKMGDYREAENYLQKTKKLVEKIKDKSIKLSYLEGEVEYCIERGLIDDAENFLKMAMEIANEIGDEYEKNYALQYMAKLRCLRNEVNDAIKYYDKIIGYFERMRRRKTLADILYDYGKCLSKKNKDEAIEKLERAKEIYRDMSLKNKEKDVCAEISKLMKNKD